MADQDDIGIAVGAWNALIRRARIGRERKAAALILSSYADSDGTRIHCGIARLAIDLEVGYSTARRYLAWLRDAGLVELVRPGNRRGLSDEYRLVLGENVLEHVEVLDPGTYHAVRTQLRDANRASSASRTARAVARRRSTTGADVGDLRPPGASADIAPTGADLRPPIPSAEDGDLRSPKLSSALTQGEPPPPMTTSPDDHTYPKTSVAGFDLQLAFPARERTGVRPIAGHQPGSSHTEPGGGRDGGPAVNMRIPAGTRGGPRHLPASVSGLGFCVACYVDNDCAVLAAANDLCRTHLADHTTARYQRSARDQRGADHESPTGWLVRAAASAHDGLPAASQRAAASTSGRSVGSA